MNKATIKVTIPVKPYLNMSGRFVDELDFTEFLEAAGGRLGIALFKGDFRNELCTMLQIAQVRGRKAYHEQLVEEAKRKRKNVRKS